MKSSSEGATLNQTRHIVFYDGECGLCQHSVQWLLNRDKKGYLLYAPLQGDTAKSILSSVALPEDLDSIVYCVQQNDNISAEWYSTGVLRLLQLLPVPWSFGRVLLIIPRFIRDGVYRFIAKNRIKWFGNADACRLPAEAEQARFLP